MKSAIQRTSILIKFVVRRIAAWNDNISFRIFREKEKAESPVTKNDTESAGGETTLPASRRLDPCGGRYCLTRKLWKDFALLMGHKSPWNSSRHSDAINDSLPSPSWLKNLAFYITYIYLSVSGESAGAHLRPWITRLTTNAYHGGNERRSQKNTDREVFAPGRCWIARLREYGAVS